MASFYLVIVPQGTVPSWSRANIATNSGWTAGAGGTIAYHDADTDPGTGATYQFVPDASGLTASTPYDLWAVWDDGTTTVGPVAGTTFETTAPLSQVSSDASAAYTLRGSAFSDVAANYAIRVEVSSAASAAYNIRAVALCDAAVVYVIRTSLSADAIGLYTIENAGQVATSATAAYTIRAAVSGDAAANYAVRTSSNAEASSNYTIRTLVQLDALANYVVRSAVFASRSASYTIRAPIVIDGPASYRILGDFGDFPDPSTVLLGTIYGPGGVYVGTLPPGGDVSAIAAAVWAAAPALTVGKFIALK